MNAEHQTSNAQRRTEAGSAARLRELPRGRRGAPSLPMGLLCLLCLLWCPRGMNAAGFGFMQQKPLSFSGLNLFSPGITSDSGGTSIARQDRAGFTIDSKTAGDSA